MKAHRFDPISFFSGLLISLIGLLFLVPREPADLIDVVGRIGGWFWPALFLAVGLAVLVPMITTGRKPEEDDEAEEA